MAPRVPSPAANGSCSAGFIGPGNAFSNALKPIKRINGLLRSSHIGRWLLWWHWEKQRAVIKEIKENSTAMLNHLINERGRDCQHHQVPPMLKAGITQPGVEIPPDFLKAHYKGKREHWSGLPFHSGEPPATTVTPLCGRMTSFRGAVGHRSRGNDPCCPATCTLALENKVTATRGKPSTHIHSDCVK